MPKDKHWINGSGYYDPTAAETIDNLTREEKARNKEIHDAIHEIKNILKYKNLELIERIKIKDTRTGRKYT